MWFAVKVWRRNIGVLSPAEPNSSPDGEIVHANYIISINKQRLINDCRRIGIEGD